MEFGKQLLKAAQELIQQRYPQKWGGAAAICLESGQIITSIAPDTKNDALSLCMEVGALLEAHKLNEKVTHSLCVYRKNEHSDYIILSPCGICQERLVHWGGDVKVAISNKDNQLIFKTIRDLQPYHWSQVDREKL